MGVVVQELLEDHRFPITEPRTMREEHKKYLPDSDEKQSWDYGALSHKQGMMEITRIYKEQRMAIRCGT